MNVSKYSRASQIAEQDAGRERTKRWVMTAKQATVRAANEAGSAAIAAAHKLRDANYTHAIEQARSIHQKVSAVKSKVDSIGEAAAPGSPISASSAVFLALCAMVLLHRLVRCIKQECGCDRRRHQYRTRVPRTEIYFDDVVDDEYFNDLPTPPSDSRHRRGDPREGSKLIPGASAADADHSEERRPALPDGSVATDEISVAAPVQTGEDGVRVHDAGSPALAPAPGPEAEPEAPPPDEAGEATPGRAVQMF